MKKIEQHSHILPQNTVGFLNPVIPIEQRNTAPVDVVRIDMFTYIPQRNDALPAGSEDTKEIDASKFPLLRGFD